MKKTGAIILAAGLSSRMGDFKPLLPLGDRCVIDHSIDVIKQAGVNTIAVVTGHRAHDIETHLQDCDILFVHNKDFRHTQMLHSLTLGLAALEALCERVLILPADVPLAESKTVLKILEQDGPFVRPIYKGEVGHPVAMSMDLAHLLYQYRGEGGLRGAIESNGISICEIAVDDRGILLDADTQDDYARLKRYYKDLCSRRERE